MTDNELKVLLAAAQKAKLDPANLKPQNPFRMEGPTAKTMQIAVADIDPVQAARWRNEAGQTYSLAAAAARSGITEHTAVTKQELLETDPDFVTGQMEAKAAWEAKMLGQMDDAAAALSTQREKQTAQFKRQAGSNTSSGQHNKDFLRRLGVQNANQLKGMSPKRIIGG